MKKNTIDDKEVKVLEKQIAPVAKRAIDIEIASPADMKKATETLSQLNVYADALKEKKNTVLKPLNEAVKAYKALFSPVEDKLDEAIGSIRSAMTEYQTEQKRIADAKAAKISEKVATGKMSADRAVEKLEDIKTPEASVEAETGSVKFKTVKKFEVMDVTMLPHEYVLPDEVKIRKAMIEGIELDGVRYYTEEIPVNSR